jgi:hypothetical protein
MQNIQWNLGGNDACQIEGDPTNFSFTVPSAPGSKRIFQGYADASTHQGSHRWVARDQTGKVLIDVEGQWPPLMFVVGPDLGFSFFGIKRITWHGVQPGDVITVTVTGIDPVGPQIIDVKSMNVH